MKRKTLITTLVSFLCITSIIVGVTAYYNRPQIDDLASTRDENEVAEGNIFFDDNAVNKVPLWVSSSNDGSLRAQATLAYETVNTYREDAGIGALVWDSSLESAATVRAVEASQKFSHTRPDGTAWYTVDSRNQGGENLAFGYNTADSVMSAWMASSTHAYNIMYGKFKRMAISCYQADNGKLYWAQEFGY